MKARLLDDEWLRPYENAIRGRSARAFEKAAELAGRGRSLADWASAHEYYGLHKRGGKWIFREWAPNATSMWLVGDFSGWKTEPRFEVSRIPGTDDWEAMLPAKAIKDGDNYRLEMRWEGGRGERIPAYARYVVQDPGTNLFCAKVWEPKKRYVWKNPVPPRPAVPLVYEAHVGMAGEEPRVSTYREFARDMLPRIKAAGYNTVQLMAIMEHPYYGSFGYHVSTSRTSATDFRSSTGLNTSISIPARRGGTRRGTAAASTTGRRAYSISSFPTAGSGSTATASTATASTA